ncbi:MAG TPA: hypothetical protein VIU33_01050 [Nitrospiria bacterium]
MKLILTLADYTAALLMGIGTLFLVSAVVSEGWNMFLGMLVGMVLGFLVLGGVLLLFMRVSTAFEIFPVGMPITMVIGMAVGMKAAAGLFDPLHTLPAVVVFSFLCQLGINQYNKKLRGEVPVENGNE